MKIQILLKAPDLRFEKVMAKAIAGFTGDALKVVSLTPAINIAPKYDPAKIIVWMALSLVNLVFSSVDDKYMKTKKNAPNVSKKKL